MTKPAQERCGVCNWPIVDNGTRIEHVDFDHLAEPAATEQRHGTGSGEAKCAACGNVAYAGEVHRCPTPPASQPTVETLQLLLEQSQKENALLYEELTQLKARVKELMNHLSSSGT